MNKITRTITIVLFFGMLIAFPVITVFSHKDSFSQVENRNLSKMPEFSVEGVKDRSYMKGLENYLSDHFVLRSQWIGLKSESELAVGKKEINDIFVLNDRLVEKFDTVNETSVKKSIDAINKFAIGRKGKVFFMVAPTAPGIYADHLPKNAPSIDQKAFIDSLYSRVNHENVTTIDVFDSLLANRDDYIYYRTDHHWTTLGAYYAYSAGINKMGFQPLSLNSFDIEHASNDFLGTLYSKVVVEKTKRDTIDFFYYKNGSNVKSVIVNDGRNKTEYSDMYFRDWLTKKDKYSAFLGNNQPVVTINTDVKNGKKLLVIKDSYAHCFVPFLSQHYSQIDMVDMRYIMGNLNNTVNVDDYDQYLFLFNASNFAQDDNLKKLNLIK